ncbi:AIP1 [Mytilus edulis]|uniref:DAB2IP n=1 Tax=Mytilus edulis TaxID=6550 RepID=A0A8S3SY45_MYTED|nr:AIP1 [Mytilus edulis]
MVSATLATVLPLWWVYAKPTWFWPYRDNFYGPPSGVATAPPLAPALPVAVSLTSAVAPSTTVPDSQASSSSHGTQVSDHASPLDGLQKLLLDFGESFKAEFSTLSSRMTLLENRVSSHQPSPAKSVECDEREDDELSVSPGSHERAFLTDGSSWHSRTFSSCNRTFA